MKPSRFMGTGGQSSLLRRLQGAAAARKRTRQRPERPADPEDLRRAEERGRGRDADSPLEVPVPGWRDILLRLRREIQEDQLSLIAAGVAYYFMLALFPALLAIVVVYGAIADPATVAQQAGALMRLMPTDAAKLLAAQLQEISTIDEPRAGLGALLALGFALWSAANGTRALIAGLNIAYDERERRGIVRVNTLAVVLTLGFIVVVTSSLALITALPHLLDRLSLGARGTAVTYGVTWLLVGLLALLGLAVVYRLGPSREQPRWQWVSVGSLVATILWVLASLAFSWYSARFGSFNKTYGTLAGGILLLLWLQITAFVTLLGAEINAEVEHQTARDSTTGPPRPLGQRGAQMADTVGEALGANREKREAPRRRSRRDRRRH